MDMLVNLATQAPLLWASGPVPGSDRRVAPVDPAQVSQAFLKAKPWDGAESMFLAMGFVLLGAAVLTALWLYRHRDRHPLPRLTYLRLTRGLGLGLADALRLWWVSRSCRLPTPITLLLCPATFDHHTAAYLARFPREAGASIRASLRAIRSRVFDPGVGPR